MIACTLARCSRISKLSPLSSNTSALASAIVRGGLDRKKGCCCGQRSTLSVVEILEGKERSCSEIKVRPRATIKAKRSYRGLKRSMQLSSTRLASSPRTEPSRTEPSRRCGLALISRDTAKVNGPGRPRTRKISECERPEAARDAALVFGAAAAAHCEIRLSQKHKSVLMICAWIWRVFLSSSACCCNLRRDGCSCVSTFIRNNSDKSLCARACAR